MNEQQRIKAMRIAGIGCVFTLVIIAIGIFMLPTAQLIGYLTFAGSLVGGGTTLGIVMLASLPPFVSFLCYYLYKWMQK